MSRVPTEVACLQIVALTGSREGAYDLRDPLATVPEYPHRPQGALWLALGILGVLGTAAAIAGKAATSLPLSANEALSFAPF